MPCTVVTGDFSLLGRLQKSGNLRIIRAISHLEGDIVPVERDEVLLVDPSGFPREELREYLSGKTAHDVVMLAAADGAMMLRWRETLEQWGIEDVICTSLEQWERPESGGQAGSEGPKSRRRAREDERGSPSVLHPQVLTIFNPKGGVGRTTLAVNLAIRARAALGLDTLLLDLDIGGGDVALHLDMLDAPTVVDLLAYGEDLSGKLIGEVAGEFRPSGISVIPSPGNAELVEMATWERLAPVVRIASRMFDLVVVDTPGDPACDVSYRAVREATRVLSPVTPDVAAVRRLKTAMEFLREMSPEIPERVSLALNRQYEGAPVTSAEIESFLDCPMVARIPECRGAVSEAVGKARPIVLGKNAPNVIEEIDEILSHIFSVNISRTGQPWWRRLLGGLVGVRERGLV